MWGGNSNKFKSAKVDTLIGNSAEVEGDVIYKGGLHVDGKVLCLGDQGHLLWIDLGEEGAQVLGREWLFRSRESWTPPALSRGLLFVRQTGVETYGSDPAPRRVMCFDLR